MTWCKTIGSDPWGVREEKEKEEKECGWVDRGRKKKEVGGGCKGAGLISSVRISSLNDSADGVVRRAAIYQLGTNLEAPRH